MEEKNDDLNELFSSINNIRNKYLSKCKLDTLYHYTNLEGFLGIVNNNSTEMWASNIEFLNDSREYIHGIELCKDIISNEISESTSEKNQEFLEYIYINLSNEKNEVYGISFCKDGDLLSQWRGYSRGDTGISIGFDVERLSKFRITESPNTILSPHKIIYDKNIQINIIKDILKNGSELLEKSNLNKNFLINTILLELHFFLPLFKNHSFSEENEWRIIFTIYNEKNEEKEGMVNYRVRDNVILPYIKLKYDPKYGSLEEGKTFFSEIIVGPTRDIKLTERSISHYLKEKKLDGIKIDSSEIPYR